MHRTGGSLRDPRAITDRRFDEERQRCQLGCWATVDHMGRRPDGPRLSLHRRGWHKPETRDPKRLLPMGKSLKKIAPVTQNRIACLKPSPFLEEEGSYHQGTTAIGYLRI